MTPIYLDLFSPFSIVERDQDQTRFSLSTEANDTSFSCLISYDTPTDQGATYREDHHYHHHQQQQQRQQEPNEPYEIIGSSNRLLTFPSINKNENNDVKQSLGNQYISSEDAHGSVKWMSSKMRFMRKMMDSDRPIGNKPRRSMQALQDQQQPVQESNSSSSNNYAGGIIRVCSDCNTTKTPLWRSGPRGPKSLCNACGIRQRKARRAVAAAAVSGGMIAAETLTKVQKEKRSYEGRSLPYKKRCKVTGSKNSEKKLFFDDVTVKLTQNSAVHRIFPQDERDAAILLMALSCGLIHG